MTLAEVNRAAKSYIRVSKAKAQERALFDYILGDLIGRSVGRFVNKDNEYPQLEAVYSHLFTDEAKAKEDKVVSKKDELSALRFRMYADFHNQKNRKGATNTNE